MAAPVIRDVAGRLVRTLDEGDYPAGRTEARWDGHTDRGTPAPAGPYLVGLRSGSESVIRRLVWMR